MTTTTLLMRVGDRLPQFTAQALDRFGAPINVTGYQAFLVISAQDGDTVFGQPSPFIVACPIVSPTLGVVRYDWSQAEMDAAVPGIYSATVRFRNIATPTTMFEVPSRKTNTIVIRPRVVGYDYVVDGDGDLVLTAYGEPLEAT
jgi:hypothetical protein